MRLSLNFLISLMVLSEDGSTIMISSKFINVWFNILLIDFPIYFSELYAGKIIEI